MTAHATDTSSLPRSTLILACLVLLFMSLPGIRLIAQTSEICDNALDDDGDGLIDLNDEDCVCMLIEPVSYIPNPSFEELDCCPQNRSELFCATGWAQASEPTTDLIHNCGWSGWDEFLPPKPFPDGDGIMGLRDGRVLGSDPEVNWKEYAGACLTNPLIAGVEYRFEFDVGFYSAEASPPMDLTFFGTTDCQNLPFGQGDERFGCPTNGPNWVTLASTTVATLNIATKPWIKASVQIIPEEDIYAIVLGPPCGPTSATVSTYYYFDNLLLDETTSFDFIISENSHPCSPDFIINVPFDPSVSYQWYKEGIALLNETSADLTLSFGEGAYQVRVVNGSFCGISKTYIYNIPRLYEDASRTICSGETISLGNQLLSQSGMYRDTIISSSGCDSTVNLTLHILDESLDTINAKIFEGEVFDQIVGHQISEAGKQHLTIPTNIGCDSNIYLNLEYYNIYFPTVFSPNNDGVNDWFTVLGGPDLVEIHSLKIFDRWGTLIYEEEDQYMNKTNGWNGENNGRRLIPGVYVYLATVEMDDGKLRQFSGNVSILH